MTRSALVLLITLCAYLPAATAQCQMSGVATWLLPVSLNVIDTQRGEFFRADTTNINSITSAVHSGDALNRGPYFVAELIDSQFVLSFSDQYADYEEYEYGATFNILVSFACTGGNNNLVFSIGVQDTNNNPPRFVPTDVFSFNIAPPIVPGYELTACYGDLTVRDIDLTTHSIIFGIEENPYFEISFGGVDPADSKNFNAVLRASSLIRSLEEPLTLQISATDVDDTGDPPLTSYATIRIEATDQFEMPAEPVFTEAFYTASYSVDFDQLALDQTIALSQGYDDQVVFSHEGDFAPFFELRFDGNSVSLYVAAQIPEDILFETHIPIVIRATREYTSGATATVIVELPGSGLRFGQISYDGAIIDNVLQLEPLNLIDTGSGVITVAVVGDHENYFSAQVIGTTVEIAMPSFLPEAILQDNSFINLQVEATTAGGAASAVVTLRIVKDDLTTPMFSQDVYSGEYDSAGLRLVDLVLTQGYDNTVEFSMEGVDSLYFDLLPEGSTVRVVVITAPPADVIASRSQLLFSVRATKPRTVGASAAVAVALPAAPQLQFSQINYEGVIIDNIMQLDPLTLIETGSGVITTAVVGDYENYFTTQVIGSIVTITMSSLPDAIIQNNSFINIQVEATTDSSSAFTVVTLQIVKDDAITPVFSQDFYSGEYESTGLQLVDLVLTQGYDDTVDFMMDGEDSQYFDLLPEGSTVRVMVISAPPAHVIASRRQLLFSVRATKPLTVGASAAVAVALPAAPQLQFSQINYEGVIIDNTLQLGPLTFIETGSGVITAAVVGDYENYFTAQVIGSIVTITMSSLPDAIIQDNSFINIQVEATTDSSSTFTVVTLQIFKNDTITPVFSQDFYSGEYESTGLQLIDLVLTQGYDETVEFSMDGEDAQYFDLLPEGSTVRVIVITAPPADVIAGRRQLLFSVRATKPLTVGASAAVAVALPAASQLQFSQINYEGVIIDNMLQLDPLTLIETESGVITAAVVGDYENYFTAQVIGSIVTITMSSLPDAIIQGNSFINIQVEATTDGSSAVTVVTLDIVKNDAITPVFSQDFYSGEYESTGLQLVDLVLTQGYDDTVEFSMDGEDAQYFDLLPEGSTVRVVVIAAPPADVIASRRQLLFSVRATKPRTVGASAAVAVALPAARTLRFEEDTYTGTLEGSILEITTFSLAEGYADDVNFIISGDFDSNFIVTEGNNMISLTLTNPLTPQDTEANNFIVLVLEAIGTNAVPSKTVIVIEIVKDDLSTPVFGERIYGGVITESQEVQLDSVITVVQGYDGTDELTLEGEHSEYFTLVGDGNSRNLELTAPLPQAVIEQNHHLTFTVTAIKTGTVGGHATISLILPQDREMQFEQDLYTGSLDNENLSLDTISLSQGYRDDVAFSLIGDYREFFAVSGVDSNGGVTIELISPLPGTVVDDISFVSFVLEASGPFARSARTSVTIAIIKEPIAPLLFSQYVYSGSYEDGQLTLADSIYLSQGYDDTVLFTLDGELSDHFLVLQSDNSVDIVVVSPLPNDILNNGRFLITLVATKQGNIVANAAFSVETTEVPVPRFGEASYVGSLEGDNLQLEEILLAEGYTPQTVFNIIGLYSEHFEPSNIEGIVTIHLINPLSNELIGDNALIVLELIATNIQETSARTAIVLEILNHDFVVVPVFGETFYTGSYTESEGLVPDVIMSLAQGFDDTVTFSLAGEHSQWFDIQQSGNLVTLVVNQPIDSAVIANQHHLMFSIIADKPGSIGASSAVSISLLDDLSAATVLRFEQGSYSGMLLENELQLSVITLIEGYQEGVVFNLYGEFAANFAHTNEGNTVTLSLLNPPSIDFTNGNTAILLELVASGPQSISTHTVIVLEVERADSIVMPSFGETFYTGSYTESEGLVPDVIMSLAQGFDDTVTFSLAGEHSQWFDIQQSGNLVTLVVIQPIDSAVIANQHHLMFSIIADKPGTIGASSAVSISLLDDLSAATVLRFEQGSYSGMLLENELQLSVITLIKGYQEGVVFNLYGEFAANFAHTNEGNTVTISLLNPPSIDFTNGNKAILLELVASGPQSISTHTVIVLEVERADSIVMPSFGETFYTGSYTESEGLVPDVIMSLAQGFDDTVTFSLAGEHSQWFDIQQSGNLVTLVVIQPIDSAVIANQHHLMFSIIADKPGTIGASSAVSISLLDDLSAATVLRFEQGSYSGMLLENELQLSVITLIEGYREDVVFNLYGEFAANFAHTNEGNAITLSLLNPPSIDFTNGNTAILLELVASGPQSISTHTVIVLEVERADSMVMPSFGETFYTGSYTESEGLVPDVIISLAQGFDDTVTFSLSGEHSQWFDIQQSGNLVTLVVIQPIDSAVIANQHHLMFSIIADKPGTIGASSAVSISLLDDLSAATVLRFEQGSYSGMLLENELQLSVITLIEGYREGVVFNLYGEFAANFAHTNEGNTVTLSLLNPPSIDFTNGNTAILLELIASGPQSISTHTVIVLEVERADSIVMPSFGETFYTGSYTESEGLVPDVIMSLAQGFDDTVTFSLAGEHSQWFDIQQSGNLVTLVVIQPIDSAVIANQHHLMFSIIADKPGTIGASSAVSISLLDDLSAATVLRFEQGSYSGMLLENELQLTVITLIEGYREGVVFNLYGEFAANFAHTNEGNGITISLLNPPSIDFTNGNTAILLELVASGPQSISTHTVIVLEVERADSMVMPSFGETFYTGSYTESEGLVPDVIISLAQGFDDTVTFSLSGEHSQWFDIEQSGNLVTMLVIQPIDSAVIANQHHLIFSIIADKPGTIGASSAVSISLLDDLSAATVLRFEQGSYSGMLLENELQLSVITLIEGYREGVVFNLYGEFAANFAHTNEGNTVTLSLLNPPSIDFTNGNTAILLELVASGPQSISTHTVIVLEVERADSIVMPSFGETFYTGSYTESEGLVPDVIMSLAQGFDDTVTFSLAGEHSQWFDIQQSGNLVTLVVIQPIDSAVIANQHHLMFSIIADKPGTIGASSAVSISLLDDLSATTVLRFEQGSYSGMLLENELQLSVITLIEGYREGVVFNLYGEFAANFAHTNEGNTVTLSLLNPPSTDFTNGNTAILLELVASGPQSISTHTVIVLEVERADSIVMPSFGETFYTGSYTESEGLVPDVIMSLAQGFDDTVTFSLAGEHSQWFDIQQSGNLVTLVVIQPIDSAVIANQHHLMFSIIADKPGTIGASSAVSISLLDDLSATTVLRFEQGSYSGMLLENELQLSVITLIEGYREGVVFNLYGEFAANFAHANEGNTVTLSLLNPPSIDFTNGNTAILLELVASGPQSISTHTVIVLEVERADSIVMPSFGETFYTGSYTESEGLVPDVIMSLAQGFDDTVTFSLAGEHSQWFDIQQSGNLVTLVVIQPIDSAVIANQHHLMFSIIADKPGTIGASSAVSISLLDDLSAATVLRFEQGSYSGMLLENELQLSVITLIEGYREGVVFNLYGEFAANFAHANEGNTVTLSLLNPPSIDFTNGNTAILLELVASGPQSISTHTVIVLEVERADSIVMPSFGETFYTGSYTESEGLVPDVIMSLAQGFDDTVTFSLAGEHSQWFDIQQSGNLVTLVVIQPIDSAVIANQHHLMFSIIADKPGTIGASSAVSISLLDDLSAATVLRFEQGSYSGMLLENELQLSVITLIEGYREGVVFNLYGEFAANFAHTNEGNTVTLSLLNPPSIDFTNGNTAILLELIASGPQSISTHTVIVLEVERADSIVMPSFGETFYTGSYTESEGLVPDVIMSLAQGFDDTVTFSLAGEHSQWFDIQQSGNLVTLVVIQPIDSAVIANQHHLMFSIIADKPGTIGASSAVFISLLDGGEYGPFFERALYRGRTEQGVTGHELILLYGYTGTSVDISGDYASQFHAELSGGGGDGSGGFIVTVQAASDGAASNVIPPDVAHVALLVEAGTARTALVIDVMHTESSVPPTVLFELDTYVIRADSSQNGLLGRVSAVADNGETLIYSLNLQSGHYLADRLSVSSSGELWLSAPANSGSYQFGVYATTVASHITAETTVYLTVDSVMVCGTDDRVVHPLIVLERDEEVPHEDIVLLNADLASECSYSFNYRWPQDRDWLYINDRGHLSARAIDREDPAIAFMALSQVQIELVLTCSDTASRSRHTRDVSQWNQTDRNLGPYEYGNNRWILTDSIEYNSRRSFVNLIVNDINDNPPIFVDKENEPIVVGYPVANLLDVVSPSALVLLQATDADIGENAELVYWSAASELAVSARSGAVYVRDNAARALVDGVTFTVHATDRAGAAGGSLTGDIDVLVRLLEIQHIAVLTIRDALLENEGSIIDQLSNSLNYEVKSLRATVISDEYDVEDALARQLRYEQNEIFNDTIVIKEDTKRENVIKRNRRQAEASVGGASLRIYIYALEFTEPIEASQLISDIENSSLSETWIVGYEMSNLREHLESINIIIYEESSKGLLVSTIVLSCLLFLVIVFIIIWYIVVIRKRANNYNKFRDSVSQSSNRTIDDPPLKIEDIVRPRPDIEEIKRTERRLQEMLHQPVLNQTEEPELITIEPIPKNTVTFDTISELPHPSNNLIDQSTDQLPIVIQSIDKLKTSDDTDDDDEYGEINKSKRKSVVTFNEQVEKIIHLDNISDDAVEDTRTPGNLDEVKEDLEVYRL